MGLTLSKAVSYYGFNGVRLDASGNFVGFIRTTGDYVYWDGTVDSATFTSHFVTSGAYISALRIQGPADGFLTVYDTSSHNFTVPMQVSVPTTVVPASSYNLLYNNADPTNTMIDEIAIGTDQNGGTVLTTWRTGQATSNNSVTFQNAGVVGWVEDSMTGGFVGFINDDGTVNLLGASSTMLTNNMTEKFFSVGYVLSQLHITRSAGGNGSGTVQMVAINSAALTQIFNSAQTNVLPIVETSTQIPVLPLTAPVMKSLTYLSVPGTTTHRLDFLIASSTFQAFTAPNSASYVSTVPANPEPSEADQMENPLWIDQQQNAALQSDNNQLAANALQISNDNAAIVAEQKAFAQQVQDTQQAQQQSQNNQNTANILMWILIALGILAALGLIWYLVSWYRVNRLISSGNVLATSGDDFTDFDYNDDTAFAPEDKSVTPTYPRGTFEV